MTMKVGTSKGQSFSQARTSHVLERMAEKFSVLGVGFVSGFLSILALKICAYL
jgi:Na+-transporting methylmalonyl-CoA/oxaloacetate decarboxylase gamma subunit